MSGYQHVSPAHFALLLHLTSSHSVGVVHDVVIAAATAGIEPDADIHGSPIPHSWAESRARTMGHLTGELAYRFGPRCCPDYLDDAGLVDYRAIAVALLEPVFGPTPNDPAIHTSYPDHLTEEIE